MKKILFSLATLALILASCAKTEIVEPQARVMHLTATIEEPADTRALLEEIGTDEIKSIRSKWGLYEKFYVAFVQGEIKKTGVATVTSISEDKRSAEFSVTVPQEITGNFTLYAYSSPSVKYYLVEAGKLLETNPVIAILRNNMHYTSSNLSSMGRDVFSFWAKQSVNYSGGDMPAVKLSFKHLGAMMTIKVKNISSANLSSKFITKLAFNSTGGADLARSESDNAAYFNMETNSYLEGKKDMTSYLPLTFSGEIVPGGVKTLYKWFVPAPYTVGNTIQVRTYDLASDLTGTSGTNTKAAIDFQPGKNYVVYVTIDGTGPNYVLKFSNAAWE